MAIPSRRGKLPNWAIGGLLFAFVGGTYLNTIRRVGNEDDLEKELERELAAEAKKQEQGTKDAAKA